MDELPSTRRLVAFSGASDDGSKVFFLTNEQLATSDTDASFDFYQRSGGVTTPSFHQHRRHRQRRLRPSLRQHLGRRLDGVLRHRRAAGGGGHRLEL